MSPRTGRPKAKNPKKYSLKIRFDEATNEKLLAYCQEHGINKTEAFRRGLNLLLEQKK